VSRVGDIGSMRHRIAIQAPVDVPDGAGGFARSWQPVTECWASVSPILSAEYGVDQRLIDANAMRFVIRWQDGLDATMRVQHGALTFGILSIIDPDQQKRHLVLQAQEARP
jgi:SPP1 family predicted phage head-tail adaptor